MSQWMQGAVKHKGAFTRKAKRVGMTPAQFARTVLANTEKYSATTVRQANLARTFIRASKKR